ncbi:MAG: AAA domain-containing protein, partial [Acidimicrobiales bacterium]
MPKDADLPADFEVRENLKNLLKFTEELFAARDNVVFDIFEYPLHLTTRDLLGEDGAPLPGITFGVPGDMQAWFSFARCPERQPPPPEPSLAPWLRSDPHPIPGREPALVSERIVEVSLDEATDLIEAGLAECDVVSPVGGEPSKATRWTVPLRPSELPEITTALQAYIGGPWRTWAMAEAPRRKAVGLYEEFFKAHAQISAAGGEGSRELVVGLGIASWRYGGKRIVLPLIEQRAELELDDSNGTLTIEPRNVSPAPALMAFMNLGVPGAAALQREMTKQLEDIARDQDVDLHPLDPSSFKCLLENCAARLDASGVVLASGEAPGPPTETLRISPIFCLIVRSRREDFLRDDLRRLRAVVLDDQVTIPETARRFVSRLSDEAPDHSISAPPWCPPGSRWGGTEGGGNDSTPRRRVFFPLAANDEQEEIVRCIEEESVSGVVVQGPPGTGKTHTIANIIGHLMAEGRRVLV